MLGSCRGVSTLLLALHARDGGRPQRTPCDIMLAASRTTLIDFTDSDVAGKWMAVDDRIMGGASTSRVVWSGSEGAISSSFEGELVVEGGGFASVRYVDPISLSSDVDALALDVRGDGRMGYKLTLSSQAAPPGVSYQYVLPSVSSEHFQTLRLPLASFRATYRGRPASEAPALRAADVQGVGLMLSRYEADGGGAKESIPAGTFRLQLRRLAEADSELSINGRRWVPPRRSAPRSQVSMAVDLPNMAVDLSSVSADIVSGGAGAGAGAAAAAVAAAAAAAAALAAAASRQRVIRFEALDSEAALEYLRSFPTQACTYACTYAYTYAHIRTHTHIHEHIRIHIPQAGLQPVVEPHAHAYAYA